MNELEKIKFALAKSGTLVYEWDTAQDIMTWYGDVRVIVPSSNARYLYKRKDFTDMIHRDDKAKYISSLENSLKYGGDFAKTYRIIIDHNRVIYVEDKGTVIKENDTAFIVGTLHTTEKASQPVLHSKPAPQATSHAANVKMNNASPYKSDVFFTQLSEIYALDQHNHHESVLLKISVDNLPLIMTWYSMEFADRIMNALEITLGNLLKPGDIIQRIGIDRFGVIISQVSNAEIELLIDQMLKHIQLYKNPSFTDAIHIRTSIGSVTFPLHTDSPDDAINKAYLALSNAKLNANQFYLSYEDMTGLSSNNQADFSGLQVLQNAFKTDNIALAFQPIVDSTSGLTESYECLLRIPDENGGLKSAGNLIPIAEKMGIIDIVDQYVLEKVVDELRQNKDIRLGFNVSNMTTDSAKWLKLATNLLTESDIASRIIVEITETAAQRDMRQTAYFVASLQALGCQTALDDFGAGYTSFRQLKSLSVDIVKIDGSYIQNLNENYENQVFIKTLLEFTKSYGLKTVAECVENGEIAKMLIDMGADFMQGYYFGKPETERPWLNETVDLVNI